MVSDKGLEDALFSKLLDRGAFNMRLQDLRTASFAHVLYVLYKRVMESADTVSLKFASMRAELLALNAKIEQVDRDTVQRQAFTPEQLNFPAFSEMRSRLNSVEARLAALEAPPYAPSSVPGPSEGPGPDEPIPVELSTKPEGPDEPIPVDPDDGN